MFFHRVILGLKSRLLKLGTIVGLAIILSIIFGVAILLIEEFLPAEIQETLLLLRSGDWESGSNQLKNMFGSHGDNGRWLFVLLQFAQTFLAPIPGQVTAFYGGYIFGFNEGLWLTMLGVSIGVLFSTMLSRLFGNLVVEKFVPKKILAKFDYLLKSENVWDFFLIFLLPGLPDDAVCFVAGITRIKIWKLILTAIIGRLPGTIPLVFAGATADSTPFWTYIVVGFGAIIAVIGWLFDEEIRSSLTKLSTMPWKKK